ncbi:Myb family DNA-binding protein, SHAQKYF family [Hondaea fermentalgiana]|uniref:Myb family DNA-binding protein, SHAQKYF family n=1 Tax=Hondaea fermentalgiana TaxID=2315210 RepID=A0A2R5GLX2_9STRA|nr:Myb family DNA-binding protein, SHAQKYF family [Hondaea fermentalgiana]|eukprot:GBG31880.1 Myb family DNA-binding protein, SHAQKYF family [Hondaea fermentalgiana]
MAAKASYDDEESEALAKGGGSGSGSFINAGRWTHEEHSIFLEGLKLHGKEWKKISDMIQTRTVVQIRTHAQKYFQKVAKSTGGPVMSTSKKGDVIRPPARKRRNADPSDTDDAGEDSPKNKRRASPANAPRAGAAASSSATASPGAALAPPAPAASSIATPAPPARKPNSIRVPSFSKPSGRGASSRAKPEDAAGGHTPRTVAAATILLRPRIQHRLATGSDTPKTRDQALWLASQQERAAQVLGKPRRSGSGSNNNSKKALSWDAAAD